MEFSLKSYDANPSNLHYSNNDKSRLSRKHQVAPTTSLLGMIGSIVVPSSGEDESTAAVNHLPVAIMDSPACVSQPISLTPSSDAFHQELYTAQLPMEDSAAGEFYEQATWNMYQRIQSARKEMNARTAPLHMNASIDHFLPTEDQLTNERHLGARRRLQPRNSSSTTNFVNNATGSDWSFLHFDLEDNEEKTPTEISSCDDTEDKDDDPIFDMDDL